MLEKQRLITQKPAEPNFWGDIEAEQRTWHPALRIAYSVAFAACMAGVYALASWAIYGSPLGPLESSVQLLKAAVS